MPHTSGAGSLSGFVSRMRSWHLITFGAIFVLSLGTLAILACKPSEPSYEGLTLTHWLVEAEYPPVSWNGNGENPLETATRAVRAIGTNGVPTLLRLIQARDSSVKLAVAAFLEKQSVVHFYLRNAQNANKLGLLGFLLLGTNAQVAVPSLLADSHSKDPELRSRAAKALLLVHYSGAL